jgi:hypothetical protein
VSAPPDVVLRHDWPWVPLPAGTTDVAGWATAAVAAAERHAGLVDAPGLTRLLTEVATTLVNLPVLGSFLLLAEPQSGVSAVARMSAIDLGDDLSAEQVLEGLTEDPQRQASPPQVHELATPAGPAHCLRQRLITAKGTVQENVQYLWVFAQEQAALVLGTAFLDLVEAQRWAPLLEDLAFGLEREVSGDRADDPA